MPEELDNEQQNPDVDEFGIPKKKAGATTQAAAPSDVDEFGIPRKKKDSGQSGSSGTKVQPGEQLPASDTNAGKISSADDLIDKTTPAPFIAPVRNDNYLTDLTGLTPGLINKNHSTAVNNAIDNLNSIDLTDTKKEILKDQLQKAQMGKMQSLMKQNPIDATATTGFRQQVQKLLPKESPISLDDNEQAAIKDYVDQDQRYALKKYAEANPDKAPQIKRDLYLLDKKDSVHKAQVLSNSEGLGKGDLDYSIWHGGQVQKPQGAIDSFLNGWNQRKTELNDFEDFSKLDDAGSIKKLEEERANANPEEPVPTAKGIGAEFSNMMGSNAIPMAKGAAVSVLSTAAASPEAAPWLAAAITTPEYTARGMVTSLKATYNQLRDQGMGEAEAYKKAKNQATIDGAAAAAQGALQTYAGVKMGGPEGAFKFHPNVKGYIGEALNTTKDFLKESLPNAAMVGGLEAAKNVGANINGVKRDYDANVFESAGGQLMFEAGLGMITKGVNFGVGKVFPKYKVDDIKRNIANAPQETIDQGLAAHVENGDMTVEQATDTRDELIKQKEMNAAIPEKVVNPEVQAKIQKLIEKRTALEKSKETLDPSYHSEINDKIKGTIDKKGINDQILELTNSPEAKIAPAEVKAEEPATGKSEPAADATVPAATASENTENSNTGNQPEIPVSGEKSPNVENTQQKEQPGETKNNKIVYEDGKRVAYTKEGEKIPQFITVPKKGGKPGETSTVTNKKWTNVMNKHAENYNYNFGEKAPDSELDTTNPQEAASHFIESSNNPAEIAESYATIPKEPAAMSSKEQAIADHGIGKVKSSSFYEFDDRNNTNNNLARSFLVGDDNVYGHSLDEIAHAISEHSGQDIQPSDIADYMKRFPGGEDPSVPRETNLHAQAKDRFEKLTGIPLNDKTAAVAIQQLHAEKVPEAINNVEHDAESMPDDEILKWLHESQDFHNFEDDGTTAVHSKVRSGDNVETENGRDHKQPTGPPESGTAAGDVHKGNDEKSGVSKPITEEGSKNGDQPAGNDHEKLADDFDAHMSGKEPALPLLKGQERSPETASRLSGKGFVIDAKNEEIRTPHGDIISFDDIIDYYNHDEAVSEGNPLGDLSDSDFKDVLKYYNGKAKAEGLLDKIGKQESSSGTIKSPKTFDEALARAKEIFKDDPVAQRAISLVEKIAGKSKLADVDFKSGEHEGHDINENALGYSFPDKSIGVNWKVHASEAEALRTFLHEGMHNATRDAINNDPAFRNELDGLLDKIRDGLGLPKGTAGDALIPALVERNIIPADKYGASNAHELIAEVFTNPKFNDLLKGMEYKGSNLLKRVFDKIVKYFSSKYKNFADAKSKVSADNVADYLMGLTENVLKNKQDQENSGEALPMLKGTSAVASADQKAVEWIAKKLRMKVDPEDIKNIIADKLKLNDFESEDYLRKGEDYNHTQQAAKFINEGRTEEQISEYLNRKGVPADRQLAIIGDAKANPLDPEVKAQQIKDLTKNYFGKENDFLGNKELGKVNAAQDARDIQDNIKASVKEDKSQDDLSWKDVDRAIHLYNDMRGLTADEKAELTKKVDPVTHAKELKILKIADNLNAKQKAIADNIKDEYERVGAMAVKEGIIKEAKENYVARAWEMAGKAPSEVAAKFKTSTKHSMQRTLGSILQGYTEGMHLKIEGASNNLSTLKVELNNLVENKRLLAEGMRLKTTDGDPLFTTHPMTGYTRIESPSFKKMEYQGKLENYSAEEQKVFGKRKDIIVGEDGGIMKKSEVYAPDDVAKSLNNILKVNKPGAIQQFNQLVKQSILSLSGFHYIAFTRAHTLSGKGLGDINPVTAYRSGLEMIADRNDSFQQLVKNGMTIGREQDFVEGIKESSTKLGQLLDKNSFTKGAKDKMLALNDAFHKHLFGTYGAGLKAFDAVRLYENELAKNPTANPKEVATRVAKLMNDTYGGINWQRERGGQLKVFGKPLIDMQDPSFRSAVSLLLLAPDWTASNLRMAKLALNKGEEGALYRKAWARVILRGAAVTMLANAMMATLPDDEEDKHLTMEQRFVKRYKESWNEGKLRSAAIDISPLYHWLGGSHDKAYFSIFGAYTDPLKMLSDPLQFGENKFSFVARGGLEALTSQDWQKKEFTTVDELVGMDDKGKYVRDQGDHKKGDISESTDNPYVKDQKGHKAGDEKGGKLAGKLTKYPQGGAHPVTFGQLPSFALSQVRGMMPTAIQNLWQVASGENDATTSIMNAAGSGVMTNQLSSKNNK